MSILPHRVEKLVHNLSELQGCWPDATYRDIACCVGRINSLAPVFRGRTQIRAKMLQTFVNIRGFKNKNWDDKIESSFLPLYAEAYSELLFWAKHIITGNFRPFTVPVPGVLVWTDASQSAAAGVVLKLKANANTVVTIDNFLIDSVTGKYALTQCRNLGVKFIWAENSTPARLAHGDIVPDQITHCKITHRQFSSREKTTDSNERELIAALYTIYSLREWLHNTSVNLHVDNINAAAIIMAGSNKPRLQYHAKLIDDICIKFNIDLHACWIPRDLNIVADKYSKMFDPDSYSIHDDCYQNICIDFNVKPDLDVMASIHNRVS
jgi:hypothetical protein